jgi:threonine dehydrogenase-like Zn-dependent dehydrogenase
MPMISDPRDILLKITGTTVCGSDLHLYNNTMLDMHDGDILGHEFMGIIEQIGDQVKKVRVGQRVVVAFNIACGFCDYCKREEYSVCDTTNPSKLQQNLYGQKTAALFGYSHLTGGVPGGQAEYVRVPFADMNCLAIPDDVPDNKALYLSDIIPTAYHGCYIGNVKEGSVVAIWGLGPIGLLQARWCQIIGAKRIIGIDCVEERLNIAKKLGIETINFKEVDTTKRLLEMEPNGVDCSLEAAGFDYAKSLLHKVERFLNLETDAGDILTEMITCTRKAGTISIIGVYNNTVNHFPIGPMMEKHLTVTGGQSYTQKHWKFCLDKIRSGEMDPSFVVSHNLTLSQVPDYYKQFDEKEGGALKCFGTK